MGKESKHELELRPDMDKLAKLLHLYLAQENYGKFKECLQKVSDLKDGNGKKDIDNISKIVNSKLNGTSILQKLLSTGQKDVALVEQLIDMGADVNYKTKEGATPLMIASAKCTEEIVRKLLEKGAKLSFAIKGKPSDDRDVPNILPAVISNNVGIVKLFIQENERLKKAGASLLYDRDDFLSAMMEGKFIGVKKDCMYLLMRAYEGKNFKDIAQISFEEKILLSIKIFFLVFGTKILNLQSLLIKPLLFSKLLKSSLQHKDKSSKKYEFENYMKNVYVQKEKDAEVVFEKLKKLSTFKDTRLDLIRTVLANKEESGSLDIIVSQTKKNLSSLLGEMGSFTVGVANASRLGKWHNYWLSRKGQRKIFLSQSHKKNYFLRVFVHEGLHRLLWGKLATDGKENRELLDIAVTRTLKNVDNKINELVSNMEKGKTDSEFEQKYKALMTIRSTFITASQGYVTEVDYVRPKRVVLEEFIARIGEILLYAEQHPDRKEFVHEVAAPIIEFFDSKMAPMLERSNEKHCKEKQHTSHLKAQNTTKKLSLPDKVRGCIEADTWKLGEIEKRKEKLTKGQDDDRLAILEKQKTEILKRKHLSEGRLRELDRVV